jgi:hypothetical protein
MDMTIITGLASLFGCACMFLVCAAQVRELLAAVRPAPAIPHPWETPNHVQSARPSYRSSRAAVLA